jgi:hypothetical protein
MWAVVGGIVIGIALYTVFTLKPLSWLFDRSVGYPAGNPEWIGVARVILALAWVLLGLSLIVVLPVFLAYETLAQYRGVTWKMLYDTELIRFGIGVCAGVICASWYRDARTSDSENLKTRGIFVGTFTLVALLLGLAETLDLFSGLSKITTPVASVEFDLSRKGASNGQGPTVKGDQTGNTMNWSVTERISLAMSVLYELANIDVEDSYHVKFSNGVEKDLMTAQLAVLPEEGNKLKKAADKMKLFLVSNKIDELRSLLAAIHETKRDANPVYFDRTAQNSVQLSVLLREIVLHDVSENDYAADKMSLAVRSLAFEMMDRKAMVDGFAEKFVTSVIDARKTACMLKKENCADKAGNDLYLVESKEEREERKQAVIAVFPSPEEVRSSPYLAIVASALLYAGGESEGAIAILDFWLRQNQPPSGVRKHALKGDKFDHALQHVQTIRILNLIGLYIVDDNNTVHVELGTKYQWSALDETNKLVAEVSSLKAHVRARTLPSPADFDLVKLALANPGDRRRECAPAEIKTHGGRYFLYRRWALLNNIVDHLAAQPQLLAQPTMSDRFDDLIENLRGVRADCLARDIFEDLKRDEDQQTKSANDALWRTLDTLARAQVARAELRRTNSAEVKFQLCEAYRAAYAATKWAGAVTARTIDYDPEQFFVNSLSANGSEIVDRRPHDIAEKLRLEIQQRIERIGLGACTGRTRDEEFR